MASHKRRDRFARLRFKISHKRSDKIRHSPSHVCVSCCLLVEPLHLLYEHRVHALLVEDRELVQGQLDIVVLGQLVKDVLGDLVQDVVALSARLARLLVVGRKLLTLKKGEGEN